MDKHLQKCKKQTKNYKYMLSNLVDLVFCWPIINAVASKSGAPYITAKCWDKIKKFVI